MTGKLEEVSVKAYHVTEEEYFGQLFVLDSKGATLWEGPRVKDRKNREPFLFGAFIDGCSLPEIVADIDGDGKVEMLSTAPVSDVAPGAVPGVSMGWEEVCLSAAKGAGGNLQRLGSVRMEEGTGIRRRVDNEFRILKGRQYIPCFHIYQLRWGRL